MTEDINFSYYYLQSDWYDASTNEKIWLHSKNVNVENNKGTYDLKITGQSSILNENKTDANNFSIIDYSKKCLVLQDIKSQVTHRFLPPLKIFTLIHEKSIVALDVAPNEIAVSASSDGTMKVWDTCGEVLKCELKGHYSDVNKCRFFPSNEVILSAGSDMLIKIWSAINGSCPVTLKGHKSAVNDIAIVDRGRNIVSVGRDGLVKLWSCAKQTCIEDLFDLSSNNKIDSSCSINACTIGSFQELDLGKRQDAPNEDCVSTSDKILLLATESGFIYGLGIDSKQSIFNFNCQSPVNCISFCQGLNFVVGTDDGNIYMFDVRQTNQPKTCWNLSRSSVLDIKSVRRPFNGIVSARQDGSVDFIYDNHKEIVHLTGSDCDPIYQVAYDDKFVYTACRDGKVRKYFLNNAFE